MGNLDQFPSFDVRGVRHSFTGYNTGITNRQEWIANLQKVVAAGVDIIGEVPYHHYTFIAIGTRRRGNRTFELHRVRVQWPATWAPMRG